MKRSNQSHQAGELFSMNIFGQPIVKVPYSENSKTELRTQTATLEKRKPAAFQLAKINELQEKINLLSRELRKERKYIFHEQRERTIRAIFTQNTEDSRPTQAVYPYLTNEAIKRTMDNYRLYVAEKNAELDILNEEVRKYNAKVSNFNNGNEELTDVQIEFRKIFFLKNSNKKPKEYNELVETFNTEYGNIIEKKKYITLKYTTEIVFQQMLHLYGKQLQKYSDEFIKIGITHKTTVRQFEVHSHHITSLERNGVKSINVCNATIRNHRERLEEFGVLCHYVSQGNKKAVKMHINSQILVVFDTKTENFVESENQAFTPVLNKVFKDNNDSTRTFKNNINKRENGQADFLDKGTPSAGFLIDFYKNIPQQEAKSKLGAAAENVKISKTLSEKMQNAVIHPQEFAKQLSQGTFFNHKRIDARYFYEEARTGTLTREEFKEVILQEFFKNASKLYRNSNVFIGCWKKAINNYTENLFKVNNGNGVFLYSKELMVDQLQQMLWRINHARKWFDKAEIKPLFPSDYFDFTRQNSKEIGFEYTKKAYQNHLKYLENKPKIEHSIKKKAVLRTKKLTESKKFEAALNRFFKNKIQLSELIQYVDDNLPTEFMQKLSNKLIKLSNTQYQC